MSISSLQLARVSNLLRTSTATSTLASTQKKLLETQQQLSTGRKLVSPSDDAGDAAVAQQLRKTLEKREAYSDNLEAAKQHLGAVDSTLADVSDLVREAQQIASANIGSDVPADSRLGAAEIIKSLYSQLLSLGNKQANETYLFGGTKQDQPPFVEEGGGVKFQGSTRTLSNEFDERTQLNFMVGGDEVFGAMSTRVQGAKDLSPTITATTRLADLNGTTGAGIKRGMIAVSNGTVTVNVDLSKADTIGDITTAINAAGVGGISAAISAGGNGITISGGAGETISVNEVGGGTTANDLGIRQPTALGAGVALAGDGVGAKVTGLTSLANLGGGTLDLTSGLKISNGAQSATIDFAGTTTVEDLLNRINGSDTGVRAEINADATGINIFNPNAGSELRIGENGGTTAADLGIRSLEASSPLSQLNGGKGVRTADGNDLLVTRSDGSTFEVDLSAAATMTDVISAINIASGGTAAAGAGVNASFATSGNGLVLTDTAGGAGQITIANINFSHAAEDLGIDSPAAGNVITGADVHPVQPKGLFGNIAKLRNALLSGDQQAITAASEGLDEDYKRITNVRGQTGARVQELESRTGRLEEQNLATTAMLSLLEDADYTEAITRLQTLQLSLQASMQSAGRLLNLSLMDFLG